MDVVLTVYEFDAIEKLVKQHESGFECESPVAEGKQVF